MEWKLTEARHKQYSEALEAAREAEANLGSLTYKINQLCLLRRDIDKGLKSWWEEVIVEMKLDSNKNYMITRDGVVQDVAPKGSPAPTVPAAPAEPVSNTGTVEDLK